MTEVLTNILSDQDIKDLIFLRHALHRNPELSGDERETAARIVRALEELKPDNLLTGLGGHGVAAIFESGREGPSLLFRAELDGLPIEERSDIPHRSLAHEKGHMCGHDGHMAILLGVAKVLSRRRPKTGKVTLLFQPAEENGSGAKAVLEDPAFNAIRPDFAFALHNMPGLPFGYAALAAGPANCASRGMKIVLRGTTAHASSPHEGNSPVPALADLSSSIATLAGGTFPGEDFRLATITHLSAGAPSFGVAPGDGEIRVTLRTLVDERMMSLVAEAENLVRKTADRYGLQVAMTYEDVFAHCENHPDAVAVLQRALEHEAIPSGSHGLPMRASEDFGRFGKSGMSAAMVLLGAGENHPNLHNPDYDFPDGLIPLGVRLFCRIIEDMV